jgi:hypothetical protein
MEQLRHRVPKPAQRLPVLDWLLGENAVELWVGGVESTSVRSPELVAPGALHDLVNKMAQVNLEDRWTTGTAERKGNSVLITTRWPIKRLLYPTLDLHLKITLPYAVRDGRGWPDNDGLVQLRNAEDDLVECLAKAVLLVAHLTVFGTRTIHFYADSLDPQVLPILALWERRFPSATIRCKPDPAWVGVSSW